MSITSMPFVSRVLSSEPSVTDFINRALDMKKDAQPARLVEMEDSMGLDDCPDAAAGCELSISRSSTWSVRTCASDCGCVSVGVGVAAASSRARASSLTISLSVFSCLRSFASMVSSLLDACGGIVDEEGTIGDEAYQPQGEYHADPWLFAVSAESNEGVFSVSSFTWISRTSALEISAERRLDRVGGVEASGLKAETLSELVLRRLASSEEIKIAEADFADGIDAFRCGDWSSPGPPGCVPPSGDWEVLPLVVTSDMLEDQPK